MTTNQNQPREFDAVLGGEVPPPLQGAVLGGIEGVKRRLSSSNIKAIIAALSEALNYGEPGLCLVSQSLQSESPEVQRFAYQLLRHRRETHVKEKLKNYKYWDMHERLISNRFYESKSIFANRKVEHFNTQIGINKTDNIAYLIDDKDFDTLLQDPKVIQIEALIFRTGEAFDKSLISAKDKLKSLKAIWRGSKTIKYNYDIELINISPILEAYPGLEVLKIRSDHGLQCSRLQHHNLKVLIVESWSLDRETITQICNLYLPELNHLELWLGSSDARDSLLPIINDGLFPKLAYLGICNSKYSDYIVEAVAASTEIELLKVLDLSMGIIEDKYAEFLLTCPAVSQLDILNIDENYLSNAMIKNLQQLNVQVISHHQKTRTLSCPYYSIGQWIPF